MSEFIPISQAKKMRSGINVNATVKRKGDSRTVKLKSGESLNVCDVLISDGETVDNEMALTLWGDDVAAVNLGDTVSIVNGYANSYKGTLSLTKGKFGTMSVKPAK